MKEENKPNGVKDDLAFIQRHRSILKIPLKEVNEGVKKILGKETSHQYILKIWRGGVIKDNNRIVNAVIDVTKKIIEKHKAALMESA